MMLAYAANRRPAASAPHPKTLMMIIAGHAAAVFAVMTARGDLPAIREFGRTTIVDIAPYDLPPPPPPQDPAPQTPTESVSTIDQVETVVPIASPNPVGPVDPGPSTPASGNGTATGPAADPVPVPMPVVLPTLVPAHSLTRPDDLVPPYPDDKLRMGEEASIRLRLAIGADGRVTAVSPVGAADPSFVAAARRHILRRWRYQPASRGGTPVASSETVTIRFQLDA